MHISIKLFSLGYITRIRTVVLPFRSQEYWCTSCYSYETRCCSYGWYSWVSNPLRSYLSLSPYLVLIIPMQLQSYSNCICLRIEVNFLLEYIEDFYLIDLLNLWVYQTFSWVPLIICRSQSLSTCKYRSRLVHTLNIT